MTTGDRPSDVRRRTMPSAEAIHLYWVTERTADAWEWFEQDDRERRALPLTARSVPG